MTSYPRLALISLTLSLTPFTARKLLFHLIVLPNLCSLGGVHICVEKFVPADVREGVQMFLRRSKFSSEISSGGSIFLEKLVPGGNQSWGVHFRQPLTRGFCIASSPGLPVRVFAASPRGRVAGRRVGLGGLCRHNLGHNRALQASSIMRE